MTQGRCGRLTPHRARGEVRVGPEGSSVLLDGGQEQERIRLFILNISKNFKYTFLLFNCADILVT